MTLRRNGDYVVAREGGGRGVVAVADREGAAGGIGVAKARDRSRVSTTRPIGLYSHFSKCKFINIIKIFLLFYYLSF